MANITQATLVMKWKEVKDSTGVCPKPRHGHRCVAYGKYVIIIGGGNEGIIKEINVYNTANGKWFYPSTSFAPMPGCAAFGIVCHENNLIIFGGIHEEGRYSNDIYKISLSNWNWNLCLPTHDEGITPPCPRLGHSFTLSSNNAVYMFGGLSNEGFNVPDTNPRYLNDLYKLSLLEDGGYHWSLPVTTGQCPSPRESHSAVIYNFRGRETLIIYGGMCGHRLGDIHFLDTESLSWSQPITIGSLPPPRSLHVAGVCQNKMIVFGGWIPATDIPSSLDSSMYVEMDWKCTNNVSCLNLDSLQWENVNIPDSEDLVPRARAGHCGVVLNNRLYIWSGRDGFRKSWNDQVCCKDLWFLETSKALPPARILMDGSDTLSVSVKWDIISNADFYIIQVMKVGQNTVCNSQDVKSIIERNINMLKKEAANKSNNRPLPASQGLPALKFVPPALSRPEDINKLTEIPVQKNEGLQIIDINNPHGEGQHIDMSNLSVDLRNTWVHTNSGEKIPTFSLVPKINDDLSLQNASLLNISNMSNIKYPIFNASSTQIAEHHMANDVSNSIKSNGVHFETPQGKPLNIITPEDMLSQPSSTKHNYIDPNLSSRNLPPLGVSLFPINQSYNPRSVNSGMNLGISPKKLNVFSDIPVARWFESIIVSEPKATITQFYVDVGYEKSSNNRTNVNRRNVALDPNYTYRLRIASVNSCGIGPFSAPLTFSTSAPGLPGPPSSIKIVRKGIDTYLLWSPGLSSESLEYSVYISKPITPETVLPVNISHLKYIYEQVYQGRDSKCIVSTNQNSFELYDKNQAYLMLRIVAKNSKGYGPVTQIKWFKNEIQDIKTKKSTHEKSEIPLKRYKLH